MKLKFKRNIKKMNDTRIPYQNFKIYFFLCLIGNRNQIIFFYPSVTVFIKTKF